MPFREYGKMPDDLVITDTGQIGTIEVVKIRKDGIKFGVRIAGGETRRDFMETDTVFTSGFYYEQHIEKRAEQIKHEAYMRAVEISKKYDAAKETKEAAEQAGEEDRDGE